MRERWREREREREGWFLLLLDGSLVLKCVGLVKPAYLPRYLPMMMSLSKLIFRVGGFEFTLDHFPFFPSLLPQTLFPSCRFLLDHFFLFSLFSIRTVGSFGLSINFITLCSRRFCWTFFFSFFSFFFLYFCCWCVCRSKLQRYGWN